MSLSSLFTDETEGRPFTVLTVCTGNICRSPLAEALLRKVLAGLPVRVHSSGTLALTGQPMTEENQIIASEFGVDDVAAHRARPLALEQVRESDLVLALTRDHRRAVVELLPRASRHVFTLREFARLAEAVDSAELSAKAGMSREDRLRSAVELVAQLRGTLPPLGDADEDDVIDPYRQSDEVYTRSAQQIVPAVNQISRLFRAAVKGGDA